MSDDMHTHQLETDTTTEEREILLQRATEALDAEDSGKIKAVRDQLREHREMYAGDQAMNLIETTLIKLDSALGEKSPDTYAYTNEEGQ
jgi:hypothetical protein